MRRFAVLNNRRAFPVEVATGGDYKTGLAGLSRTVGASPSGKASVFGIDIRRFESSRPSHFVVGSRFGLNRDPSRTSESFVADTAHGCSGRVFALGGVGGLPQDSRMGSVMSAPTTCGHTLCRAKAHF